MRPHLEEILEIPQKGTQDNVLPLWEPNTYRKIPYKLLQLMTRHQAVLVSLFMFKGRAMNSRLTDIEIEKALGPRYVHPSRNEQTEACQQNINNLLHELHNKQFLIIRRDKQGKRRITVHPNIAPYFTNNPKDYLTIPPKIFLLPIGTAKKVFLAYKQGWPNRSLKWIAKNMGISYTAAKRHQKECIELGLLRSDKARKRTSNGYTKTSPDGYTKTSPDGYTKTSPNIYRYNIEDDNNDIYPRKDIYHYYHPRIGYIKQLNKLSCNSFLEKLQTSSTKTGLLVGGEKEDCMSVSLKRKNCAATTKTSPTNSDMHQASTAALSEDYDSLKISQSQPLLKRKPVKVAPSHLSELQDHVFNKEHIVSHRPGTKAMAASARVIYGLKQGLVRVLTSDQILNIATNLRRLGVPQDRIEWALEKQWSPEERQDLYNHLNNYFSTDYGYTGSKQKVSLAEALYHPQARFSLLLQVHFFPPKKKEPYKPKPITIPQELQGKAEKVMKLCNIKSPTKALLDTLHLLEEHYHKTVEPTVIRHDLPFNYNMWFNKMIKFFEYTYGDMDLSLGRLKPESISMGRWDEECRTLLKEMINRKNNFLIKEEERKRREISTRLAALEDVHGVPFDYNPETDVCFPLEQGQQRTWGTSK